MDLAPEITQVAFCYQAIVQGRFTGLQNAFWKLGEVPKYHTTDNLTSAVNPVGNLQLSTEKYESLANHYAFESCRIEPGPRRTNETLHIQET